jgi:hypothetical protein
VTGRRSGAWAGVSVVAIIVCTHWVGLSSLIRFAAGMAVLVVLPGAAIVEVLSLRAAALERWAITLTFGFLGSSIGYWITGVVGMRWLFPAVPAASALILVLRLLILRRRRPEATGALCGKHIWPVAVLIALVGVLAVVPLAFLPFYGHNLARGHDGTQTVTSLPDATLHLSLANELRHAIPPDTPFLAGRPLAYHYGGDLAPAMFADWSGVATTDLVLRLLPAVALGLLVLCAAALGQRWTGWGLAGPLFALLVVFGEDLSYVPGLLLRSPGPWNSEYFRVPTVDSLYLLNPMVMALVLLFVALLCLSRSVAGDPGGWPFAFAFAVLGLWEYKVFAAGVLVVALALAGPLTWLVGRRTAVTKVRPGISLFRGAVIAAVAGIPSTLYVLIGTDASSRLDLRLQRWADVANAASATHLLRGGALRAVDAIAEGHRISAEGLLLFALVAVPVYFVGSLGFRLVGLAGVFLHGSRFAPKKTWMPANVRTCVAMLLVVGPLLTLGTFIGVGDGNVYNNSVWFFVTSKQVAWLFAVDVVASLRRGGRGRVAAAVTALLLVGSIPATIQFFAVVRRDYPPQRLSAAQANAVGATGSACRPGDVAITPPVLLATLISTSQCETFGLDIYGVSFTSRADLASRLHDAEAFWSEWLAGTCPSAIINRYHIRVVLAARTEAADRTCVGQGFRTVGSSQRFVVLRR